MFEYVIVTQIGQNWVVSDNLVPSSPYLLKLLNTLGQKGWEAVSIGDLGGGTQGEILLKRRKP